MTGSDYFDYSTGRLSAGGLARSGDLNTIFDELDTGLQKLPTEAELKRGTANYAADTGAADAYVVALAYNPGSFVDGMEVIFKAANANTGAATINLNSLGLKGITRGDGSALVAGDIGAGKIITLRYNSTPGKFEIQGGLVGSTGTGTMAAQNASNVSITGGTVSGVTLTSLAAPLAAAQGGTGNTTGDAPTLGGFGPAQTATASKVAVRDSNGKLAGDILGNAATATSAATAGSATSATTAGDADTVDGKEAADFLWDTDGGNVGLAILAAETEDAAQDAIGAGAGGKAVLIAADETAVQAAVGLPRGYKSGLIVTIGTDAAHDVDIAVGECRAVADDFDLRVATPITVAIDASGANGLDTGAVAASTQYYVLLLSKADLTKCGVLSLSDSAPTEPAGYTAGTRLLAAIKTKADSTLDHTTLFSAGPDIANPWKGATAHFQDQKPQNTAGGTAAAGDWRTRDINTTMHNRIPGMSLAANEIMFPTGMRYKIEAGATVYDVGTSQNRLYNMTGAAVIALGLLDAATTASDALMVRGEFSPVENSAIQVQTRPGNPRADVGFGAVLNVGIEVYNDVWIEVL